MDRDEAFERIYSELRSLAAVYMSRETPGPTLQPTALVHEVYIKLRKERDLEWGSRSHFLAISARAMRQVLIDFARKRGAQKRGGACRDVTVSSVGAGEELPLDDFVGVHMALDTLSAIRPNGRRQAQLIEYVWFGGMSFTEAAEELGISRRQAHRDWAFARMWLERELRG